MEIKTSDFEISTKDVRKVLVLPNIDLGSENIFSTDSISFIKYLKKEIDLEFYHQPEGFWEQRSIDWLGPTLFLTGKLLYDNPDLLNILFEMLSSYVREKLPNRDSSKIKINVICKKDENTKSMEINYEGDINGLDEIKNAIELAFKD
ncbi:hypothetical protein [Enterobacter hormaechei]|uniref:hypothetical protein n=1 Tax=Enterobacter hormaechei TaxID=158836 RepID=UPI0006651807|nr:hypothetical protein [Enterobacter hormaechei]HCM9143870.1 hypothetical protein [Enterobacter hormaechei subsp. steigerwaltii]